jgi:hypothetical protein
MLLEEQVENIFFDISSLYLLGNFQPSIVTQEKKNLQNKHKNENQKNSEINLITRQLKFCAK